MRGLKKRQLPLGWYPETKVEVLNEIKLFLKRSSKFENKNKGKYGGVVPHASWYYSGDLASAVMENLKEKSPELVILYGGHLPPGEHPLITTAKSWQTPLGNIELETELSNSLKEKFRLGEDDYPDNTLEVQLPLIKYYFPVAKLLALRLPASMEAARLSESIIQMVRQKYKRFIVLASTDLTHYGKNYDFTPAGTSENALDWVRVNDKGFIDLALCLKTKELIDYAELKQSACSSGAVAGLTAAMRLLGVEKGELVDYKTSYEVEPASSFVGYCGIIF